jgi:molybdopterin molybdotransferase
VAVQPDLGDQTPDRALALPSCAHGVALAGRALDANGPRQDYMRCTLSRDGDGNRVATPFDKQDSSMLSRLAEADALLVRAPHAPARSAGDRVEVVPIDGGL